MASDSKAIYAQVSGGVDSSVALYYMIQKYKPSFTLPIFADRRTPGYNTQKAYEKEIKSSKDVIKSLGRTEDLYELRLPMQWYGMARDKIKGIYPYGRNLFILSGVASLAAMDMRVRGFQGIGILTGGFTKDDGPDCSTEFLSYFGETVASGINPAIAPENTLAVEAPFSAWSKADIVNYAVTNGLGEILLKTWSCYEQSPSGLHCGQCAGCKKRIRAFEVAGAKDVKYDKPN